MRIATSIVIVGLSSLPLAAWGQDGSPPAQNSAPGQTAAAPVSTSAPLPPQLTERFGVGVRLVSQVLRSEGPWGAGVAPETSNFMGAGVTFRWRFAPRASVQLALEKSMSGLGFDTVTTVGDGNIALAWHLLPYSPLDPYLFAGVGAGTLRMGSGGFFDREVTDTTEVTLGQAGAGFEYRRQWLGLGADVRGTMMGRSNKDETSWHRPDLSWFGLGVNLTASAYF